jgi:hypothetical protein
MQLLKLQHKAQSLIPVSGSYLTTKPAKSFRSSKLLGAYIRHHIFEGVSVHRGMNKIRKILDGVSALRINLPEKYLLYFGRFFGTKLGRVKVILGKTVFKSESTNSIFRVEMSP